MGYYTNNPGGPAPPLANAACWSSRGPPGVATQPGNYIHILCYSPSAVVQHYHPPWSPKEPDCAQKSIFLSIFFFFAPIF